MKLDFQPGNFLAQLNNLTVENIYKVDFNNKKDNDNYLPWLIYLTFRDFDKFLEIEGDLDGDHIKINFYNLSELNQKLDENDFPGEVNLWKVYNVEESELLGNLIGKRIEYCEYGIDKEIIEGKYFVAYSNLFNFIRLYFAESSIIILEGGSGLFVSDDKNLQLMFEDTFNRYFTK